MSNEEKIILKDLSYELGGLFFKTHNKLGRFCREFQYAEFLANLLKENNIKFEREKLVKLEGIGKNRVDFCIEGVLLVDLKAKSFIEKEDYYQMRRYLEATDLPLGIIVNFRQRLLRPKRVLNPKARDKKFDKI